MTWTKTPSIKILGLASLAAIVCLLMAAPAAAASTEDAPTFTKDVLPIFQQHCQACHREKALGISGLVAPFSLTSYEETRPWARAIARAVVNRDMPPWGATQASHGMFRNERSLSDEEIDVVARWVEGGAQRGREEDAPPPLEFSDSEWWLGEPDLIVQLPEPVWVGDDVVDWQPNIYIELTEDQLPEDRYLRAVECQPGSEGVHHIVLSAMPPGTDTDGLDGAGRGKGIGGLAPGSEPTMALDGYGVLLERGSTIRANMHYNKEAGEGTGFYDQSKIALYFYPKDAEVTEVLGDALGTLDFQIPPGQKEWTVGVARTFDRPFSLLSYLPHTHLRGVAAEYTAHLPDGTVRPLLDVPNYDYNWQTSYEYHEPHAFPAGTRIELKMTYDNSPDNPSNPDPTKAIGFGLETQNEMTFGFLSYVWDDEEETGAAGSTGGGN